ncbi:serine/threonine specific protein phosphatase [Toxoplasma gondii ARI]|uniref:Serine/threonine specific protein phosphatase n=1 Tax=Toxoplasma gondii ARI TaxID=1074872 RepID=A0A139Y283_TOXGO|nr:serine/threonine specific protein phosphatase [Toxoplasma gondii ARI]
MENVDEMNTTTEVKCVYNGRLEVPTASGVETPECGQWDPARFQWRSVRVFLDDGGLRFWNNLISILDIATVDIEPASESSRLVLVHMDQAFPTLSSPFPPFFRSSLFFPSSAPPGQTSLVLRIPTNVAEGPSDYGDLLTGLLLLQKTAAFLGGLRPMFRRLRDQAICADEVRNEFLAFQLRESALTRPDTGALAEQFLQSLPADRAQVLRAGFLQRDCSVLEEAVAYVPVVVYEHLRAALPLLPQLSVDPTKYRVWRQAFLHANADNPELCECLSSPARSPRSPSRARLLAEVARATRPALGGDTKTGETPVKPNLQTPASIHMGVPLPLRLPEVLPFKLSAGGCRIAKGRTYRCEDAYFLLEREGAFGVFDGVGSWAAEGIDASRFSTALAHACSALAQEHLQPGAVSSRFARLNVNLRARELLGEAHSRVRRENPSAWGSSTAVVGVFDSYLGQLGVACLGDSVLTVLRRQMMPKQLQFMAAGARATTAAQILSASPSQVPRLIRKIRYRSLEQRWSNGAPYQLSNLPPEHEWDALRDQGFERFVEVLQRIDNVGDSADMARGPAQPLVMHPGDLILLYSDGVADNLFDKEIEVFASLAISPEEAVAMGLGRDACTKAQDVADMICKLARRRAADRAFDKPFVPGPPGARHVPPGRGDASSAAARRGAKRDDISCVAIWVEGLPDPSFESCKASVPTSTSDGGASPPTEACAASTTVSEESTGVAVATPPQREEPQPPPDISAPAPESGGEPPVGELGSCEADFSPRVSSASVPEENEEEKAHVEPKVDEATKSSFAEMRAGSRIPLPPRGGGETPVAKTETASSRSTAEARGVSVSRPAPRLSCRRAPQRPAQGQSNSGRRSHPEAGSAHATAATPTKLPHAAASRVGALPSGESESVRVPPQSPGKAARRRGVPGGTLLGEKAPVSGDSDPSEKPAAPAKRLSGAARGAAPVDSVNGTACTPPAAASRVLSCTHSPQKGVSRVLTRLAERSTRGAHSAQLAKRLEAAPLSRKRQATSPPSPVRVPAKKIQKPAAAASDSVYKPNASSPLPGDSTVSGDDAGTPGAGRPEAGPGVCPPQATPPPADLPRHLARPRQTEGVAASEPRDAGRREAATSVERINGETRKFALTEMSKSDEEGRTGEACEDGRVVESVAEEGAKSMRKRRCVVDRASTRGCSATARSARTPASVLAGKETSLPARVPPAARAHSPVRQKDLIPSTSRCMLSHPVASGLSQKNSETNGKPEQRPASVATPGTLPPVA